MGSGKVVRCKECGCEFDQLVGVGFLNKPVETVTSCPNCGSTEFEDTDIIIMWD